MNLSFIVLIIALVLAGFGAFGSIAGRGPTPWAGWGYFHPASWFCFLLSLVLAHGGINVHG